ncbi:MAG: aconitate hydratase AcnA, partial [Chloroflexota bacterium]
MPDLFKTRTALDTPYEAYTIYRLAALEEKGYTRLGLLPYSIRSLLESTLRQCDGQAVTQKHVVDLAGWTPHQADHPVLSLKPARLLMQDLAGLPALVDLAAMRSAVARLGGDPRKVNPLVPVDLVIDHSVQVDYCASPDALSLNTKLEFQRNRERYEFLHWGQKAFDNFRVVPPDTGIIHQVNLEFLAQVVAFKDEEGSRIAFLDTVLGTDSHTTMVNSLGVVGWGIGGIEAEAAMLGQPVEMLAPDVTGVKLSGKLPPGVNATDLTLTLTQLLRKKGVVDKFVEFYGPGVSSISLLDRATIANMAPDYGATMSFFPVDDETLRYLRLTGRPEEQVALVEAYCKAQGLFRTDETPEPEFTDILEFDLGSVVPCLAGPKRPQDRVPLESVQTQFRQALSAPVESRGYQLSSEDLGKKADLRSHGPTVEITHGSVVIAAITSCTNTSNPSVMVGAGILARRAVEHGLKVKPHVKTSLAPGSRVVADYLEKAGLLEPLAQLGFHIVGYGCTTCLGNSGPLPGDVTDGIREAGLVAAAVISGNRNFEGRVHSSVRANYLASPPLVVAYAIAGTVDIDLTNEPLGYGAHGQPVYLRDIWPDSMEVDETIRRALDTGMFRSCYAHVFADNEDWKTIPAPGGVLFPWDASSTYIQEPPFFAGFNGTESQPADILGARPLAIFGDSITTDHISPVGNIAADSPAGQYLITKGIQPVGFNSYGARRGNDRVMVRGAFANVRLKNHLVPGVEGGFTIYMGRHNTAGPRLSIYEAAMRYKEDGVPLIVLAGREYGTGSSRDWAAKGTLLLGVRAVIAESYERIHRSNLAGMGILPLQFKPGESIEALGLTGTEIFDILIPDDGIYSHCEVSVRAAIPGGNPVAFNVDVRLDTP